MIVEEDNKYLRNVVFSALSFLLAPLPCYCSGVPGDSLDDNGMVNASGGLLISASQNIFAHVNKQWSKILCNQKYINHFQINF